MQEFNEVSPPGWSGSVAAMLQKHPELPRTKAKNPWALAWYMKKKKGAKPHYKEQPGKHSLSPKKAEKKAKYKHEDKPKRKKFSDWLVDRENVLFENRDKQFDDVSSALMSLRNLAPEGIADMSVTKIGDLLDKEGKVPDDISSLRFAAMIKSMARGASRIKNRPDLYEAKKLAKDILDDMPPKKSKKKK